MLGSAGHETTSANRRGAGGFALMGVLVAVAVAAILAGVLGPMAYRQVVRQREEATRTEMADLATALRQFHADTGRLPTQAEGLTALITDPGLTGWQGPYLVGDRFAPADQIGNDAFGRPYLFERDPATLPPGNADLIIVSGGADGTVTSGAPGSTWNLTAPGDDLQLTVQADGADRDMAADARREMQAVGAAAQAHFTDHAAYPAALNDLVDGYLDPGLDGDAVTDPWQGAYLLSVDAAADPPALTVRSRGPDGVNDGGAGDDLQLTVDATLPGRRATTHLIRIAQAALDARPAVGLTGVWASDRDSLELSSAFALDGWSLEFGVARSTRTVVSAGPDGNHFTAGDNIPAGVVPD